MAHRYAAGEESPIATTPATRARPSVGDENEPPTVDERGGMINQPTPTVATSSSPTIGASNGWIGRAVKPGALSNSVRALSDVGNAARREVGELGVKESSSASASAPKDKEDEVPRGVDATSYMLGQKHALETAFMNALPQRQLLGALQLALHDVREKTRALERTRDKMSESLSEASGRGAVVEASVRELSTSTIPAIERTIGELKTRLDLAEGERRRRSWSALGMEFLWTVVAGVDRVEAAAGRLSERVLFSEEDASSKMASSRVDAEEEVPQYVKIMGACALVAVLELATKANVAVQSRLPERTRRATSTFSYGLNACRNIVWASVFAQSLAATKSSCQALATFVHAALSNKAPKSSADSDTPDEDELIATIADS